MTAIILQARLDSSRLPNKALLDLCGLPVISRVMQTLNKVHSNLKILACPQDSFDALSPLAAKEGFKIFCGPKEDVLERFCQVIEHFSITRVIRATGDNPFVNIDAANEINAQALELKADYAGYSGLPYGAGVESVNATALIRAGKEAKEMFEREHVCPYLYNNPNLFKLHRPLAPVIWQGADLRLTIDTQEDYENAKKLFASISS